MRYVIMILAGAVPMALLLGFVVDPSCGDGHLHTYAGVPCPTTGFFWKSALVGAWLGGLLGAAAEWVLQDVRTAG